MTGGAPAAAQSVDWVAIAPPALTAVGALVALLADVLPGPARASRGRRLSAVATLAVLLTAALALVPLWRDERSTFCVPGDGLLLPACSYAVDGLTWSLQAAVLGGALLVALLAVGTVRADRLPAGETWFLLLCAVTGALVLAGARDVLTLVVALETATLPTVGLVALRRDALGAEAGLKLFLVSVVSTALTLFGLSLVYGATGAVHLDRIATALERGPGDRAVPAAVLAAGLVLAVAGFAVKVAAVPFHVWAPEVYAGAPVPVAAYLSVVSKAAGFAGLLVLLGVGLAPAASTWGPALAVVAGATMTVGNLVALRQTSAVRLLAWSSIAQSGYILVPLGAVRSGADVAEVLPAAVAYLLAYVAMNVLAFAVVVLVGRHRPSLLLADFRGLARSEPLTAFALAFALACLAGLPPGLLGLVAKVVVLGAPVGTGAWMLALVMAVNVVIGLWYYLAWAASLWAAPAEGAGPPAYRMSWSDGLAVGGALGVCLLLSAAPGVALATLY